MTENTDALQPQPTPQEEAERIIAALGGPTAVAEIFGIKAPSVWQWKTAGIPQARLMYLELAYPALFGKEPPPSAEAA